MRTLYEYLIYRPRSSLTAAALFQEAQTSIHVMTKRNLKTTKMSSNSWRDDHIPTKLKWLFPMLSITWQNQGLSWSLKLNCHATSSCAWIMATTRSKAVSYYYDGEYVSQVRLVCGKVIDEGWCPIRPFNRTPTAAQCPHQPGNGHSSIKLILRPSHCRSTLSLL